MSSERYRLDTGEQKKDEEKRKFYNKMFSRSLAEHRSTIYVIIVYDSLREYCDTAFVNSAAMQNEIDSCSD